MLAPTDGENDMTLNELLAQTISLRDQTQANNPNSQRLSILERDIQRLKRMGAVS